MKKRNVVSVMVVAMLFAISLYFIGGTYARYAAEFTGDATVNVAKWNVKVDGQEDTTLNLNFEVTTNNNVVPDKIAPSVKAVAPVNVSLEDTEVAVELVVEKGEGFDEAIQNLGLQNEQLKFSIKSSADNESHTPGITGEGSTLKPFIIPLQGQSAFTQENGSVKFEVTLEWENEEQNNSDDTAAGKKGGSLTLPVKLSVKQHIE